MYFTSAPAQGAKYCDDRVCIMYVCLYVSAIISQQHTSELHENFWRVKAVAWSSSDDNAISIGYNMVYSWSCECNEP